MGDTITKKLSDGEYLKAWRQFKDEHPVAYGVAAVLPVTGQAAAVADYTDAMNRGDSVDASIAAASFIPGIGLAKKGGTFLGKTEILGKRVAPAAYEYGKAFHDFVDHVAPATTAAQKIERKVSRAIEPITKEARTIGLTADAEQIGEVSAKEYMNEKEASAKEDAAKAEFSRAFENTI